MGLQRRKPYLGTAIVDLNHPLMRSACLYWLANEGAAGPYDSSGSRNHGSLTGSTDWQSGRFGPPAINFAGSNGVLCATATNFPGTTSAHSFSVWCYYLGKRTGLNATILSVGSGAGTGSTAGQNFGSRDGGGTTSFGVWKGSNGNAVCQTASTVYPTADQWHHFAYTFDGTNSTLYDNGAVIATSATAPEAATPNGFRLGYNINTSFPEPVQAGTKLEAVLFAARAWTATEIAWLYAEPFAMLVQRRRAWARGVAAAGKILRHPGMLGGYRVMDGGLSA